LRYLILFKDVAVFDLASTVVVVVVDVVSVVCDVVSLFKLVVYLDIVLTKECSVFSASFLAKGFSFLPPE
jgi:hypothetical protein